MEKLKLISLRVDTATLAKIDDLAKSRDYYTRSSIINQVLNNVINCATPGTLWRIISTYQPEKQGYTVDFHK